jgi:hypothetical protein
LLVKKSKTSNLFQAKNVTPLEVVKWFTISESLQIMRKFAPWLGQQKKLIGVWTFIT